MQIDIHSQYLLLQVFDLAGRRIFGKEWRGDEAAAKPKRDPLAVEERKSEIETRLLWLRKENKRRSEEVQSNPSDAERDEIRKEFMDALAERDSLRQELSELADVSNSWLRDDAAYKRRVAVESELLKALRSGEITLRLFSGQHVNFSDWEKLHGFSLSFTLSIIVIPETERFGTRRSPAFLPRIEVNNWLNQFSQDSDKLGELTPETQCREWLKAQVKSPKRQTRDEYQTDAMNLITGLSARSFQRVWAEEETVPQTWKKPGPMTQ